MAEWQTQSSEVVHETPWIKIHRDSVLDHNGKQLIYTYVEQPNPSVFILPLNVDNEILLQQNYRYTIDKTIWEIPAGQSDGQELLTAAKRELMEETGLESDEWHDLGGINQVVGIGRVALQVFVAKNVRSGNGERDADEAIGEQRFFSLSSVEDMIRDGELIDSPVIASIYMAKLHGLFDS